MDSSSAQSHHQEMGSQTLESMLVCTKSNQDKKPRPSDMQSLKCPRCDSTNTKFCYYNNYSLSQPRYFCKSCRRYWTKGGTLRNVPVGGGCRKNKRSSSTTSSSSSSRRTQDQPIATQSLNPLLYESNDLSLAIARLQKQSSGPLGVDEHFWAGPSQGHHQHNDAGIGSSYGLFDAIRNGFIETNSPVHNLYYGMGMQNGGMGLGMGMNEGQEVGIPFEDFSGGAASTAATTVKQEMCGGRDGENRVLWGFPWQSVGGDGNQAGEYDSGRGNWNGIGSSTWHGLLNSPLM